jgi:NAD(P)-dependent dehydrogenase (short-subunit alcohol dehydrogenase family)
MRLSGKRLLAVGASSGIGKASALAAAAEGARVCFAARRIERIEEAADSAGNESFALPCDVRDESSCRSVVAEAAATMGGLDGVVYAPGVATFGPIEEIDAASWRAVLETNLIGASLILNAAIGHLEDSRGKAVFISSIVIDDSPPRHQQASYVISKVALESLLEAWQAEHHNVGFTSIASGDALTEFGVGHDVQKLAPIVRRWQDQGYMYGRMMDVLAVAEQVVHALASSETIRRIAITPRYA